MKKYSLSITVCLFFFVVASFAQSDRGTITGTVSDASGAVVPGVTVEAKNVATGIAYQAGTSETGNFTLPQLPVGTYELSAMLPGFKKFVRPGLVVGVAQVVRVDVMLEVGTAGEQVTVEAAAPLLKTESGEISQNFSSDTLANLPVLTLGATGVLGNIRNPLQAITLLPGAAFTNDYALRINGMPSSSQSIRIEGQDATNGLWRQLNQGVQPGMEAIQEMSIQTSNYDAEYGQAGGGYFNYTMKSGTNQLHGSAYDYFVNEALSAGLPFTDAGTKNSLKAGQHIRNPLRQNDYGFTLGGPITIPKLYRGHDRTFFFFSFEQFRQSVYSNTTIGVVPSDAYRRGDFSAALNANNCNTVPASGAKVCLNQVFDPATNHVVNGVLERDAFPNNIIP